MSIKAAVIINASAGTGYDRKWADALAEKFLAAGLKAQVTLAKNGAEIVAAAQHAVANKVQTVVAGGGDGTVNAVGSILIDTDIAFGVLPLGTLNHFARDLHIPLTLDDAIANISAGHQEKVDTGEVNGSIFLNNSSLGIYPDIVRDREKQQRRLGRGKWPAFLWATVTALRRYPFLNVRIRADGKEQIRRTPFIFIGNNEYCMDGLNIGRRACVNSGHLSLYVAQRTGRLGLFRFAISALMGRLQQERDFDVGNAKEISIETHHKRLRVATDGEVTVMNTPLHYRIHPRSLNVIVPENISASNT